MGILQRIEQECSRLAAVRGVRGGFIGRTELGREIGFYHFGSESGKQVIFQAAIHAREHISAILLCELAARCATQFFGSDIGFYIVPVVNIDGVRLCLEGLSSVPRQRHEFLLDVNGDANFSLWKANINAVDLNTNFDAGWGSGQSNVLIPRSSDYIGKYAHSECETQALVDFTHEVEPAVTVSYHCKGREIYWDFYQSGELRARSRALAQLLQRQTGYSLIDGAAGSAGGYKDYCVQKLGIAAYTLELVDDSYSHPLNESALEGELERNALVPHIIARFLGEMHGKA